MQYTALVSRRQLSKICWQLGRQYLACEGVHLVTICSEHLRLDPVAGPEVLSDNTAFVLCRKLCMAATCY